MSNIPSDVLEPIIFSKCWSVIILLFINIISSIIPYNSLSIEDNKLEKIVLIVNVIISVILLFSNFVAPYAF